MNTSACRAQVRHLIHGDSSHERQVLDQAAGLALRRVRRAQHAPLAGLQAARPTDLRVWQKWLCIENFNFLGSSTPIG